MARVAALKEEVKRLACERDGIEARVAESSERLAATGVGMDKPLVDGEVREKRKKKSECKIALMKIWRRWWAGGATARTGV